MGILFYSISYICHIIIWEGWPFIELYELFTVSYIRLSFHIITFHLSFHIITFEFYLNNKKSPEEVWTKIFRCISTFFNFIFCFSFNIIYCRLFNILHFHLIMSSVIPLLLVFILILFIPSVSEFCCFVVYFVYKFKFIRLHVLYYLLFTIHLIYLIYSFYYI